MSISPTVIIPLYTGTNNPFKVRTLLDSGSGTNWVVKSVLKYVSHTKIRTEFMEVHTFHGSVKKKYDLVEIYYIDNQNNTQPIVCYVHDSYVRHIQLDMADYILGQQSNCAPFTIPGPLADPGDTQVSHAFESLGVGLVLCSASTNKIRTPDPIIRINELDLLLEPTIFGVVISGAIPNHLRDTAHEMSVGFTSQRVVSETNSSQTSQYIMPKVISQTACNDIHTPGKSPFNAIKYFSKYMYIPENLALQNQFMDYTIWFTPIMCILLSMAKSSANFILFILASLANLFYVNITLGLKLFLQKTSTMIIKTLSNKHIQSKNCRISRKRASVNNKKLAIQRLNKSHTKIRPLSTISYHRPRLKSLKTLSIDGHKIMIYHQLPTTPSKFYENSAWQSPT